MISFLFTLYVLKFKECSTVIIINTYYCPTTFA